MRWESTKKRVAAFAAGSLISTLGAASVGLAPAGSAVPAAQSTSAFCVNVPNGFGGFTDISGSIHRRTIECLAFAAITSGKTATTYEPSEPVRRGQMATFIANAIDKANELERVALPALPANPPDKFTDDETSNHEANINRLAAAGIVSGTTATSFAPTAIVTRGQMATFINNAQRFLSGGTRFTTNEDYFVDDETSVHEANINGIASVGITAGVDATHYAPKSLVLRANMATFISRYLAVLHRYGVIKALPPATNATLSFTPTAAARIPAAAEPSTADERVYTATGLASGPYRVTLFQSSLVTRTSNVYTFTEDGSTNLASPGTVGGRIVAVNGQVVTATQSAGGISPTNGTITITVDAVEYSKLLPVIFTDQGDANTGLNLDAQNRPTEPFGVGGELETLPEPAATGPLTGDATVLLADETVNLIVGQNASTQRTYLYDTNDTFYRDAVAPANALTLAQFEAALSKDDRLDATTSYQSSPAAASVFVLENVSPPAPTAQVAPPVGETTAVITVTDLIAGATAKVYLGADGVAFTANTPLKTSSSTDADAAKPGFQVNLTGLNPGTSYEFYVTQTVGGEESDPKTKVAGPTTSLKTAATGPPTVTSASLKPARDVLVLNFSEAITPLLGAAPKVTVSCSGLLVPPFSTAGTSVTQPTGDVDTIEVALAAPVPDNSLATCSASVAAGAVQDGTGTQNNAQSGIAIP